MILQASHTHLYPGHGGTISGPAGIADMLAGGDCLVEFADGSATPARISRSGSDWLLEADAYRSAAGTDIAAKRWLIGLEEVRGLVKFRIIRNLARPL